MTSTRQPLQMVVCDWNGTLFRDRLEETFFFGLCQRAVWRLLKRLDVIALTRVGMCGLRCFGHYLVARRRPRQVPYHIGRIMRRLNRDVLRGLSRDELADYTRRYARRIQRKLDRRLLDPLMALRAESRVTLGMISSGCREGITAALAEVGAEFDVVLANEFIMDGDVTASFEFALADDKHDALVRMLAERNIPPAAVMFIGDSPQDEHCLREVGYPVVSFFADDSRKQQLADDCGAFVPADQAHFERHLHEALNPS